MWVISDSAALWADTSLKIISACMLEVVSLKFGRKLTSKLSGSTLFIATLFFIKTYKISTKTTGSTNTVTHFTAVINGFSCRSVWTVASGGWLVRFTWDNFFTENTSRFVEEPSQLPVWNNGPTGTWEILSQSSTIFSPIVSVPFSDCLGPSGVLGISADVNSVHWLHIRQVFISEIALVMKEYTEKINRRLSSDYFYIAQFKDGFRRFECWSAI